MANRYEWDNGTVIVIQNDKYQYGVIDHDGNIIVPFGQYEWIDVYDQGLARVISVSTEIEDNEVKIIKKWGIINEKGVVVLPIEYDQVWNFAGKNRWSTTVVKGGVQSSVNLSTLNPEIPPHVYRPQYERRYYSYYDDEIESEYAGTYAHDVEHLDDDFINDALDGEPEAYWNID